jgi:hypothetical protein
VCDMRGIIVKKNIWVRERAQGCVGEVFKKVELGLNFKQKMVFLNLEIIN